MNLNLSFNEVPTLENQNRTYTTRSQVIISLNICFFLFLNRSRLEEHRSLDSQAHTDVVEPFSTKIGLQQPAIV